MSFDTNARRQAKELFDALMDRLVKDVSAAARQETEAAVIATQKEADAAVAAARKEAEATIGAARKEAEATAAAARKDADATAAAARKDAEAKVAVAQKEAVAKAADARADAQRAADAQLASARADGEARLAAAQAMNAGFMESVEAARREIHGFEARLQQLEAERLQLVHARDEALTRLDAETRRANELADGLDAAVQETNLANQTASLSKVEADARRQDRELALDRFGAALRTMDRATNPSEILDALLEPLAHDFAKAAMFLVGPAGLNGWRARGLPASQDISKLIIPLRNDSLPTRAVTTRKGAHIAVNGGNPQIGLWGGPVASAVALPIRAGDGVIAVAYAEDPDETSSQGVGRKIAEMLIKHATLRLTVKGQTSPAPGAESTAIASEASPMAADFSPARQARRVKMRDGIEVVLDGSASSLVDVSTIGAQVLSPLALRPNRVVKMTLRGGESALVSKVRVMWAKFEPQGTAAAQYRVGVKFTDAEPKAVDAFMARHGIEDLRERAKAGRLKDSA
jgi:PilZ domain-containing protein